MTKQEEVQNPNSCLNKALPHEMMFTILARDEAAAHAITAWVSKRIYLGKNTWSDPEIIHALNVASQMNAQRQSIREELGKS